MSFHKKSQKKKRQELIKIRFLGRPKLVQSLDSVYTCTEILLIFVQGDGHRGHPDDADHRKMFDTHLFGEAALIF